MSAVIKTRRRKNLTLSTAVLWIVLGFAAVFFLVSYGQELLLAHSLNEQSAAQRIENAQAREENARLKARLEYYRSEKYVEQRAREDLNLRRHDEEVLIPIVATPQGGIAGQPGALAQDSLGDAKAGHTAPSTSAQRERPNWQKWFDLFNPAP